MTDVLFVYGTLRRGWDNPYARRLGSEADWLGPATVRGSLVRNGPYLGYRPEPDGIVEGELWRLHSPEGAFLFLDDYEGPDYTRAVVQSISESGPCDAWIYLYKVYAAA